MNEFGRDKLPLRVPPRNWPTTHPVPTREHLSRGWLFRCPRGTPLDALVARFDAQGRRVIEVSAEGWEDERHALADVAAAIVADECVHALNWDAIDECIGLALASGGLVIIRDARPRAETAIAKLVDCIGSRDHERGRTNTVTVVLEGWEHSELGMVQPVAWEADLYGVSALALDPDVG